VRRLRALDAERVAVALGPGVPTRVVLAGAPAVVGPLAAALRAALPGSRIDLEPVDDALALAARHAALTRDLVLEPRTARVERAARSRRLSRGLVATAALLAVVAGALQLWGERRELAALRRERMRLAPRVERALAVRATVTERDERARAIASLAAATPAWSSVVAHLAIALPRDAELTALRVSGDTVVVEGLAASGAAVMQTLRAARGVTEVRPLAPFRRERAAGEPTAPALDRFALALRVDRSRREAP
ncbi:MAG TPA: hypothetical protein VEA99_05995, partial [Gemmatimonadaceae bacterium]|nr:hypothetical protein [Gemmatimonadaceae bacterium]